jgi:hypothetical protein
MFTGVTPFHIRAAPFLVHLKPFHPMFNITPLSPPFRSFQCHLCLSNICTFPKEHSPITKESTHVHEDKSFLPLEKSNPNPAHDLYRKFSSTSPSAQNFSQPSCGIAHKHPQYHSTSAIQYLGVWVLKGISSNNCRT